MPIKTSSAKARGRKLQQYIKSRIYYYWNFLEEGDVESRSMGAGGVDLLLSPLARKHCPLAIEAKNTRKTPSIAELNQAKANARTGELPVVCWHVHGKSYNDTAVMCRLEDLLEFLRDRG
jgi:hypothetical protein